MLCHRGTCHINHTMSTIVLESENNFAILFLLEIPLRGFSFSNETLWNYRMPKKQRTSYCLKDFIWKGNPLRGISSRKHVANIQSYICCIISHIIPWPHHSMSRLWLSVKASWASMDVRIVTNQATRKRPEQTVANMHNPRTRNL